LSEEEKKKLKPEELPEEFEIPKHPDMETAERIFISKEQIKMEEIEKEKQRQAAEDML
jgi:hypothetical protein